MQVPSGGPAPENRRRPVFPEDDATFAPPPMSAYSIAVFSSNAAQKTRPDPASPASPGRWKLRENTALRASLKSKLAAHFQRPPDAGQSPPQSLPQSLSAAGQSPSAPRTAIASPHGSSLSPAGFTPTMSVSAGSSWDQLHSASSHGTDHSHGTVHSNGTARFPATHTDSPPGPAVSRSTLPVADASGPRLDSEAFSMTRPGSTNGPWLGDAARGSSPAASATAPRAVENGSAPVVAPHRLLSSPRPDVDISTRPSSSEPGPPSLAARPCSNGSSARKSRLNRRFRSLGPPKRASEVALAMSLSPQEMPAQEPQEPESANPQPSPRHRESPPSLPAAADVRDTSGVRKPLSMDSDFFKSLKRLKGASSPSRDEGHHNHAGRVRSPGSVDNSRPTKSPHFSPPQSQLDRENDPGYVFSRPFQRRQPLNEVPAGVRNASRGPDGFKKPRLPRPNIPEHQAEHPLPQPRTASRDLTPLIQTNHAASKGFGGAPAPGAHHVDADRGKKVIYLNSKQYEKLEVLGKGGTSKVYKVRSLSDRKAYALKKVSFDQFDESCVRGFKGEIDLLTKLKHEPRVVSLIDHASSAGSLYLLMECGDLDLAHALQKRMYLDTKLDPNFVRFHASEVFQCIQAVHNAGVVHSDLKPANFLFVDGILKIIDFGIANAVPDHTVNIYRNSQIGTPNYMAPEALVEVNTTLSLSAKNAATTWRVGRPSDIWSCGCIIYQMIYGRPPYASYSGQQRIMAIMNPQVKVSYPATGLGGVRVPASAITLMKKCLERNPSDRWTVEECLHCDFLKPKAVDEHFVKDLLHNAVTFGQRNTHPGSIDEKTYTELVDTILGQIKDLNLA